MMKNIFLKLTLPATLATILVSAEQLDFTKNLPIDSKLPSIENTTLSFENKISIGLGGLTYERIKQDAAYLGIGTTIFRHNVLLIAMGGYNFLISEKDVIRPMAGLGYYTGDKHLIAPLMGVGYEHAFNNTFTLGANVSTILVADFNYTVSVPLMFHFGEQKKWEFRLIPMVAHNGGGLISFNATGLGLSLGYRF